jgi:uncharacterized membrane protein
MTSDLHQAKRPVSAVLAGPYGHPLHPLLVTVPVGAWTASLVFDIASHLAATPAFLARASTWLIVIGLIGALAAATVGFLDLIVIPSGTRAARTAVLHMTIALSVTGAYVGNAAWRHAIGRYGVVPPGPLALSAVSMAALAAGGFFGAKLAFRYGVRVAAESVQAEGYTRPPAAAPPAAAPPQAVPPPAAPSHAAPSHAAPSHAAPSHAAPSHAAPSAEADHLPRPPR